MPGRRSVLCWRSVDSNLGIIQPLMAKKTISTDLTSENIAQILSLLAKIPSRLQAIASKYGTDTFTQPLAPGERTPTEILAHILHCESLTTESIYLALLKNEPLLHKIHPERDLGKLLQFGQYAFHELLDYFTFRRRVLINVLEPLTEKQWARTLQEAGKKRRESV